MGTDQSGSLPCGQEFGSSKHSCHNIYIICRIHRGLYLHGFIVPMFSRRIAGAINGIRSDQGNSEKLLPKSNDIQSHL